MSNVRVLVSDKLAEAGLRVLREALGVELEYRPGMSEDELCGVIGDYDGLVIRSATQVTPRVIEAAERLRVIGRAGIGVDNVDIPAASRRGIVVMNTPTGNSVTTAEHALALLAALAKQQIVLSNVMQIMFEQRHIAAERSCRQFVRVAGHRLRL